MFDGKIHRKWWFSIAMFVYQWVYLWGRENPRNLSDINCPKTWRYQDLKQVSQRTRLCIHCAGCIFDVLMQPGMWIATLGEGSSTSVRSGYRNIVSYPYMLHVWNMFKHLWMNQFCSFHTSSISDSSELIFWGPMSQQFPTSRGWTNPSTPQHPIAPGKWPQLTTSSLRVPILQPKERS